MGLGVVFFFFPTKKISSHSRVTGATTATTANSLPPCVPCSDSEAIIALFGTKCMSKLIAGWRKGEVQLLALATVLMVAFSVGGETTKEPPAHSGIPRTLRDDERGHVPSLTSRREREAMKCSVCRTTAMEIFRSLEKVRTEFRYDISKAKSFHALAAVEGLCETHRMHYGLKRPKGQLDALPEFQDEHDPTYDGSVLKGAWVTEFWQAECEANMDRLEDSLLPLVLGEKVDVCPMCEGKREPVELRKGRQGASTTKSPPKASPEEQIIEKDL